MEHLERLSEKWGGDLWLKRDDLTGIELSGNKVRKLEYLISDADRLRADTLITCGGIQSNHCRATAFASVKTGKHCHLLLRGVTPSGYDGNLLLDNISGAHLHFITPDLYYADLPGELNRIADKVIHNGGVPYIIPEGGSNPIGAWGYVEAIRELKAQCDELGITPQRMVCATGSGGTHAGLLAGVKLINWDIEVWSVAVCYNRADTVRRIHDILANMTQDFHLPFTCSPSEILVWDNYIGEGYALPDRDTIAVITEAARLQGLLFDPVYTGKSLRGVRNEIKSHRAPGTTILWHTGGVFGLFPFRHNLTEGNTPL